MCKNMIFKIVVTFLLSLTLAYHIPSKGYDAKKGELIDNEPIFSLNNDKIVEGDILLPDGLGRPKRQALYYIRKWNISRKISYTLSNQFNEEDKNIVRTAAGMYNALTCVKFEEDGSNLPVINVVKRGGCFSSIGPLWNYKSQLLSLDDHCLTDFVTPLHEFAHALGIFHEHSRHDRDNFIKVYPDNTMDEQSHNFDKISEQGSHIFSEYDYDSYMHYNDRAFSDAWLKTIDALDKKYQRTMGQSMFPSASVFKVINDFYQCHKQCENSTTDCLNEGYRNPNNCDACNCPEGFGGRFCEERAKSITTNCGGDFNATNEWQTLEGDLERNLPYSPFPSTCYFHIHAPEGEKIEIELKKVKMICSTACAYNNLMINTGKSWLSNSVRFCCQSDVTKYSNFTSASNLAIISLNSRKQSVYFALDYKIKNK